MYLWWVSSTFLNSTTDFLLFAFDNYYIAVIWGPAYFKLFLLDKIWLISSCKLHIILHSSIYLREERALLSEIELNP